MIHLSIGRRTRGKTTLAVWGANRIRRRMIFDPRGMCRFGTTVTTYDGLIGAYSDLCDGWRSEIVFTPDGDVQSGFELFAWHARQWVKRFPRRELAIVVDEAAFVSTDVESFMWVLRCSDPEIVQVFLTAHRPSDIRTNVRAIADHWFLFAVRQEHDLDVVISRCGPEVQRVVKELQGREFVHWDDTTSAATVNRYAAGWYWNLNPRTTGPRLVAASSPELHQGAAPALAAI